MEPREQELERELADAEQFERRERELELELELAEAEERESGFDVSQARAPRREIVPNQSMDIPSSGRNLGLADIPGAMARVMSDTSEYYDPKRVGKRYPLEQAMTGSAVQTAAAVPFGMAGLMKERPVAATLGGLAGGFIGGPAGAVAGAGLGAAGASMASRAWSGDVAGAGREGLEQFVGPAPGQALDVYRETGQALPAAERFLRSGGLASAALSGLTLAGVPVGYRAARGALPGQMRAKPAKKFVPTSPEQLERMGDQLGQELSRRQGDYTGESAYGYQSLAGDVGPPRARPAIPLAAPRSGEVPAAPAAGETGLTTAPGRTPPPGGAFKALRALGWKHKTPLNAEETFTGEWDKFRGEHLQGQFDSNINRRIGLTNRLVESSMAQPRLKREVLKDSMGVDQATWQEWKDYGKKNPTKVEILRKLNSGQELSPADRQEYSSNRRMYDTILRGGQQVFAEARARGYAEGDLGPNYWTQRQSAAGALDVPDPSQPFAPDQVMVAQRGSKKTRSRSGGDVDAINALDSYIEEQIRDVTVDADARAIRELAEQHRQRDNGDVAQHLEDWVRENVYEAPTAADISARATQARKILAQPVDVGMEWDNSGKYGQEGKARVDSVDTSGGEPMYKVTFDGQPGLGTYTRNEVLAMKNAEQLVKRAAADRIIDGVAGAAARFFIYGNHIIGGKAVVSNPVRNAMGNMTRDMATGVAAAKDFRLGQASPEKLQFYEDSGIFKGASPDLTSPGKWLERADELGNVIATQADRLSQVAALEAQLARVARDNPSWTLDRIEAEAIVRAAQQSDLRNRAFRGTQGRTRMARIFGFFQRSTVNQLSQVAQLARDGKVVRAAALVGIPAGTFAALTEAGGGNFVDGFFSMIPLPLMDAFGRGASIGGGLMQRVFQWGDVLKYAIKEEDPEKVQRRVNKAVDNMKPPAWKNIERAFKEAK